MRYHPEVLYTWSVQQYCGSSKRTTYRGIEIVKENASRLTTDSLELQWLRRNLYVNLM